MSLAAEDRELVARFLADRSEAHFQALYARHRAALYGSALRLMGGAVPEAEEIFQEAWLRACARLAEFRGESSLRTWLTGILVRCAWEQLRKRKHVEELPADLRTPPRAPALDLDRAVARLAPGFRTVLLLHDVEGYTHDEIGTLLGIDPGTSKSQLSRARRQVRQWMTNRTAS